MLGTWRISAWDFREKRSDEMRLGDYYDGFYRGYYAYERLILRA